MQTCSVCSAPVRPGARFCTRCGSPVHAAPVPMSSMDATPVAVADAEPANPVPSRIPARGRTTPPPARSTAATWALVTGIAPLIVSITGNVIAVQLGAAALAQVAQGDAQGAWAPVLVTLALVFVANAGLLTVCTITGGRGLRETANGITRGRGLAVAGLAAGGVNLVLWVAGLIASISGLGPVLA